MNLNVVFLAQNSYFRSLFWLSLTVAVRVFCLMENNSRLKKAHLFLKFMFGLRRIGVCELSRSCDAAGILVLRK